MTFLTVEWGFSCARRLSALRSPQVELEQLEQEEAPLETAVALYKEGLSLSALCKEKLATAEGEIVLLRKEAGLWQEEPFQEGEA